MTKEQFLTWNFSCVFLVCITFVHVCSEILCFICKFRSDPWHFDLLDRNPLSFFRYSRRFPMLGCGSWTATTLPRTQSQLSAAAYPCHPLSQPPPTSYSDALGRYTKYFSKPPLLYFMIIAIKKSNLENPSDSPNWWTFNSTQYIFRNWRNGGPNWTYCWRSFPHLTTCPCTSWLWREARRYGRTWQLATSRCQKRIALRTCTRRPSRYWARLGYIVTKFPTLPGRRKRYMIEFTVRENIILLLSTQYPR